MTRRLRTLLAVTVLAVTAWAPPAGAAQADVLVLQGSGTFSPPLDATPTTRSISAFATLTVVGTDGIGSSYACLVTGTELGVVAGGVGYVGANCGPVACLPFVWARAGLHATWTCTGPTTVWQAVCTLTYHQVLPTFSFDMACLGGYGRVLP